MTDQPRITTASAFPDQATIYLPEYTFWDTQAGACEVGVPVELLPGLRDAIDAHHFAHASGRSEATPASGDTARLPAHSTVTVAIHAPTEDDADRWANTIRDLVTAEHGHHMRLHITISDGQQHEQDSDDGLREQYMAAIVRGGGSVDLAAATDAVLAVRDRRIEQLTDELAARMASQRRVASERDKELKAFNAVTLELEDAKAINAEACQLIDMQKELIGTERRIVMTAMSHREDEGARIEHCDHCGRDHIGELDEAIQAADVSFAKAFPASADGPRRPGRLPDEGPAAAEPSPDGDTCRPLEINGDTIRVHGSRDLTDQERGYASEIVEAAKRLFGGEPAQPTDRPRCPDCGLPHNLTPGSRPMSLCQRLRGRIAAEEQPAEVEQHTGLVVKAYSDHGLQRWVFRCWGTDTCDGWLSLEHSTQSSAEAARDRHVAEEHGGEQPACTATFTENFGQRRTYRCAKAAGHYSDTDGAQDWHRDRLPDTEPPQDGNATNWSDAAGGATPHHDPTTTEA